MKKLLIETLIVWKGLPSYKLEVRVDYLFGILLKYGLGEPIGDVLIAEYPVKRIVKEGRKATNQPKHIDFLAFEKASGFPILVEIKTDKGSIDKKQIENYLEHTPKMLFEQFAAGWLAKGCPREKYLNLLRLMTKAGMIRIPNISLEHTSQPSRKMQRKITEWIKKSYTSNMATEKVRVIVIGPKIPDVLARERFEYLPIPEYLKRCEQARIKMSEDENDILDLLKGLDIQ